MEAEQSELQQTLSTISDGITSKLNEMGSKLNETERLNWQSCIMLDSMLYKMTSPDSTEYKVKLGGLKASGVASQDELDEAKKWVDIATGKTLAKHRAGLDSLMAANALK